MRRILITGTLLALLPLSAAAQQDVPGRNIIYRNDGTAARPTNTYQLDQDLGSYRIGANNEGFSAGGTLRWDYNASRLKLSSGYTLDWNTTSIDATDIGKIDGITNGTAAAGKALVVDANVDITAGLRNLSATGYVAIGPASSVAGNGGLRISNANYVGWRNGANTDNILIGVDGSNIFQTDRGGVYLAGFNISTASSIGLSVTSSGVVSIGGSSATIGLGATYASADVLFGRDAAHVSAQRNSTNPQAARWYNSDSGSNDEYGFASWRESSNVFMLGSTYTGTGVSRAVRITTDGGASYWQIGATTPHLTASGAFNITTTGIASFASVTLGTTARNIVTGAGSPEGAVTASIGSIYLRNDGGAGTSFCVKESGSSTTGWVCK